MDGKAVVDGNEGLEATGVSSPNSSSPAPIKEPSEAGTHGLQKALLELDAEYHRQSDECNDEAQRLENVGDTHGMNFYKARVSGLVAFDIALSKLKKLILSEHPPESSTAPRASSPNPSLQRLVELILNAEWPLPNPGTWIEIEELARRFSSSPSAQSVGLLDTDLGLEEA